MYPLLILREEIICLIMLLLLVFTAYNHKFNKESRSLLRMTWFALGHVVFDIITVLTVNHMHIVPGWFNDACHMAFYAFSMLFSFALCCHTASMCGMPEWERYIRRYGKIPMLLYLIALPFLPISYVQGKGTMYSSGISLAIAYAIALLYFLICIIMILRSVRRLRKASSRNPQIHLMIVLVLLMLGELIQIVVPELLFTSALAMVMMVNCFFISLENPVEVLQKKLQKDALTGLGSRHSYEAVIEGLEARMARDPSTSLAIVFCDINNLKYVNDVHGHAEGDHYISTVAMLLANNLTTADQIYRIGGDEFVAVYTNKSETRIQWELQTLQMQCEEQTRQHAYDVSIATGFAVTGKDYPILRDVIEMADHRMCLNKAELKRKKYQLEGGKLAKLNVTGLTDRIFEAFAISSDRSYLFLHNMETGVTRFSREMVKHFGLPGEYMLNFDNIWIQKIHPEDREHYMTSINEVHAGKTKQHEIEYRAMNLKGEYDYCSCLARVLPGKDGDPDLFAGTIINHSLQESVDALTGLPSKTAYARRLLKLIDKNEAAALLKLSITTFSRVNLLYGHDFGDEVILLFTEQLRGILNNRGEIYRLDGTKFALVLPNATIEETNEIYRQIQSAAQHRITANYMHMPLRVAGGAYMKTADFIGTEATIRSNLMYAYEHSKYDHYGSLEYYHEPTTGNSEYMLLSAIHRDAIDQHSGFYLRYQPIVDSNTEKVVGAEALLRWRSVEYGEVSPMRFIQWLETDPCYFELGCEILKQALTHANEMRKYYPGFTINVNITIQQLQHGGFHILVGKLLQETGFPAENLILELTERCRALDEKFLLQQINFFHELGVKTAMDDVGTGSSAFGMILRLPVDEVKLDKLFVKQIQSNAANQAFVKSVIDISQEKKFAICFEGIEDESTRDYLKRYSNTLFQGYYYAKPLLIQDLRDLMKKQKKQNVMPFTPTHES